jgi:hypothetical protein
VSIHGKNIISSIYVVVKFGPQPEVFFEGGGGVGVVTLRLQKKCLILKIVIRNM